MFAFSKGKYISNRKRGYVLTCKIDIGPSLTDIMHYQAMYGEFHGLYMNFITTTDMLDISHIAGTVAILPIDRKGHDC